MNNKKSVEINNPMVSLEFDEKEELLLLNLCGVRFLLKYYYGSNKVNSSKAIIKCLFANPNQLINFKMLDNIVDRNFNTRLDDAIRKGFTPLPFNVVKKFFKYLSKTTVSFTPQIPLSQFLAEDEKLDINFNAEIERQKKQELIRRISVCFTKKIDNLYLMELISDNLVYNGEFWDKYLDGCDEANFWNRLDLSANCKTNFSIYNFSRVV